MHMKQIATLLFILLLVTACGGGQSAAPTEPAPEPTAAPTEVPAEEAATEEETPTEEETMEEAPASERVTLAVELTTNPWLWNSFTDPMEQVDIEMPENYAIAFNSDGTVNVKADCNNANGSYTADDNGSLSIEIGSMTRAMCPPESRSDEFVEKLGFVAGFFFEDSSLYLDMMADGGTFQLASAPKGLAVGDTTTETETESTETESASLL
ncbi:MAG: META domain-containing protein, partial [Caldilineaceae bacterium]|nr:META domain-containing protein [Caldilineaceae bacterium]